MIPASMGSKKAVVLAGKIFTIIFLSLGCSDGSKWAGKLSTYNKICSWNWLSSQINHFFHKSPSVWAWAISYSVFKLKFFKHLGLALLQITNGFIFLEPVTFVEKKNFKRNLSVLQPFALSFLSARVPWGPNR